MPHPLHKRIDQLRHRRQNGRWMAAGCALLAAGLAVVLAAMLIDYAGRFHDPGLRWLSAAVVLGVLGVSVQKWLWPVWRRPETEAGVAQLVQQRFPQLGSRLASALEFLMQPTDDPTAGSADLRRAVVVETANEVDNLAVEEVLDPLPARRAAVAAGLMVAAAGVFAIADPPGFRVAAGRLAAPWSDLDWPRLNQLVVADAPTRLARGQTFSVEVTDAGGRLPDDLRVEYRSNAGGVDRVDEQPLPIVGERAAIERDNVQRSFDFRVLGGDDLQMAWRSVEVVDPPTAEEIQITATPPEYTGLPAGPTGTDVRVLAGTMLTLSATADRGVQAAAVELRLGEEEIEIPAAVAQDGEGIVSIAVEPAAWLVANETNEPITGSYRLRLTTGDGLVGFTKPRALRVEPDTPPSLGWKAPASDVFVTAGAVVPISVDVQDNLAIQTIELVARNAMSAEGEESASEPITRVNLRTGPESPPGQPEGLNTKGETLSAQLDWPLESLGLGEGDQLLLSVEATDYRPGVGVTEASRRVTIISASELEQRIADAAAGLARDLERALEQQRAARAGAEQLAIEQRNGQPIDRATADRLATLGYEQGGVATALTDPARGAASQTQKLLEEIENNRLDRPELSDELGKIAAGVEALAESSLPDAERSLADARRTAERSLEEPNEPAADELAESLAEAKVSQDEAVESLESLVDSIGRWSDVQRFTREAADLASRQRQLSSDARQEAAQAARSSDNDPKRRAEREKLAAEQTDLNRRFERLQQAMREQLSQSEAQSDADSPAMQPLGDALAESEDRATGGKMRDAAGQLGRGQLGRAAERQQAVAEDLEEMLDILRNRASRDPRELADQLRDAAERLAELREQAEQESGSPNDGAQADRRERLADRAERLARRMERLDAAEAGQSTQQGGQSMDQSASQSQNNPLRSQQSMQQAQQQLAQAQQELAERIEQQQEQIAQTVLQKLAGKIDVYIQRQRKVLEGTVLAADQPAVEQKSSTGRLAGDQRWLETEIAATAEELSGRAVFEMAMNRAAEDMGAAAGRLDVADPGRQTQRHEHEALTRLRHVAAVLKPDPNEPPPESQQNQPGQGGQGGQPPEPPSVAVAELKMLRLMQLDVNARTRQLEADAASGRLAEAEGRAVAESLAGEQAGLAELVRELAARNNETQPPGPPPEVN